MTEANWKSFDVNLEVKVRLTEYGKRILKEQHDELFASIGRLKQNPYVPRSEDENGYCKFQLWSLMEHFGNYMHLGEDVPFVLEILINEKNLKEVK